MFSNHFTTNFSQNAPVKKFWKSVNIWQRYGQNFVAYFLGHPVYTVVWWRYKGTWTSLSPVSSYRCYLFYLPSPLMPIDDGRQRKGQKSLKQYIHTYIHTKPRHQSMQLSQITNNCKVQSNNRLCETTSTMASISLAYQRKTSTQ